MGTKVRNKLHIGFTTTLRLIRCLSFQNFINQTIRFGFAGAHPVVAVCILLYLFVFLTAVVRKYV